LPGISDRRKNSPEMIDILDLAVPNFGLIFVGFAFGKARCER
jgi:hypothetical protein